MLFVTTKRDKRMVEVGGFRREEMPGMICLVAPLVLGPITIDGFKEMYFLGCKSPLLANAITASAIHDVLLDGIWRLKEKQDHTTTDVIFSTVDAFPNQDHSPTSNSEKFCNLRETLQNIDLPDFMASLLPSEPDNPRKTLQETAISLSFNFNAGRHTLYLKVNNMLVAPELIAKPVEEITAAIVICSVELMAAQIEMIATSYSDAVPQCRDELLAMPAQDKLPKMIRNYIGIE
ncbi:hypothetical protein [Thalassospira xiamenensis]|uniref:hypothetical protein n=1 Tax=Thalassospira xiamenensis TaxID=220697 RepID=UPI001FFE54A9|nr:hypothetical protein [Thalassospira xiamenensis]MCK2165734.1 hypothetical protein [Thalassospira xiamenensis]